MILAFPAWRRGHFKVTGSVIDAALRRGHNVRLLWSARSGKPGEDVLPTEMTARWPTAVVESRTYGCTYGCPVNALIGPSLHAMPECAPGGRRYSLDYAWEQITTPLAAVMEPGLHLGYVSEYQRAMHSRLTGFPLTTRQHVTGSTMLDAFGEIQPNDVRARYCLPQGQPVLLFLALKFRVPHAWRRWWYRYTGYHRLVRALRRYCDDAGALFVVKTRQKNLDPWFLRQYADRYVADEHLWPYTSAQLLSAATMCVHFQSGAVIEAARLRKPQVSIRLPQPHVAAYPGHAEIYGGTRWSMQNWPRWPGVLSVAWQDAAAWFFNGQAYVSLETPESGEYADRFCGPPNAAERVLDLVEREGR